MSNSRKYFRNMDEMMGDPPSWLLMSGIYIIIFALIILFFLSSLIEYKITSTKDIIVELNENKIEGQIIIHNDEIKAFSKHNAVSIKFDLLDKNQYRGYIRGIDYDKEKNYYLLIIEIQPNDPALKLELLKHKSVLHGSASIMLKREKIIHYIIP